MLPTGNLQKRRASFSMIIYSTFYLTDKSEKQEKQSFVLITNVSSSCMRRLQGNLSYMAALADRKPEVKLPPCPPYLSAPPLNMALKLRAMPIGAENSSVPIDPVADREERNKSIQDLYRRLQAVFPEHDPKNEPAYRTSATGQKPGNPMVASQQASPAAQRTPQLSNMPGPPMNPQAGVPMQ